MAIDATGRHDVPGTVTAAVTNAAPFLDNVAVQDTDEGGFALLTGNIIDPGTRDSFTLTINWGDGTTETVNVAAGRTSFLVGHQYPDDDPSSTPADTYQVSVSISDDGGADGNTVNTAVTVRNAHPVITGLSADTTLVPENNSVTVIGTFTDVGRLDTHTVTLAWSDGVVTPVTMDPTTGRFSGTRFFADDDPTATPEDTLTVTATVTDDDGGIGSRSATIIVLNQDPDLAGVSLNTTATEGFAPVRVTGSVRDFGPLDALTVTVDWGDGNTTAATIDPATGRFTATHEYAVGPNDPARTYRPIVTAIDDDTGEHRVLTPSEIRVGNLPPTVLDSVIPPGGFVGQQVRLDATATDPAGGRDEPLTFTWTVTDPTGDTVTLTGRTPTFVPTVPGDHTVILTVSDAGGLTDTTTGTVTVTTPAAIVTPTQPKAGDPVTVTIPIANPAPGGTIDFGNGTTAPAVIVGGQVSGGTTFGDGGVYPVTVTFPDGRPPVGPFPITVLDAVPDLTVVGDQRFNERTFFTLDPLGTFTHAEFGPSARVYTVTVDWGDGSPAETFLADVDRDGAPGLATLGSFDGTHRYLTEGVYTVTVTLTDDDGFSGTETFTIDVANLDVFVLGDGLLLRVFDAVTGEEKYNLQPYEERYQGGLNVATGDINGDGIVDIIVGAAVTGGPRVRVFDGATGEAIHDFFAYDFTMRGGVSVGFADVDGDGVPEIITGAGPGGGPHVKVWDVHTLEVVSSYFAYDPSFAGGIRVAGADLDGDGTSEIVAAAGQGGGPHVRTFAGDGTPFGPDFFAFEPTFLGDVFISGADFEGDGDDEIFTSPGVGGGPVLRAFGPDGTPLATTIVFAADSRDGVRIETADATGDERADILARPGDSIFAIGAVLDPLTGEVIGELNPDGLPILEIS